MGMFVFNYFTDTETEIKFGVYFYNYVTKPTKQSFRMTYKAGFNNNKKRYCFSVCCKQGNSADLMNNPLKRI